MAVHVLIAAGVVAAWLASLYVKPFGRCWRCWGKRVIRRKRRPRKCWACKGRGRRQRIGSRAVHRVRRQVAAHWRGVR